MKLVSFWLRERAGKQSSIAYRASCHSQIVLRISFSSSPLFARYSRLGTHFGVHVSTYSIDYANLLFLDELAVICYLQYVWRKQKKGTEFLPLVVSRPTIIFVPVPRFSFFRWPRDNSANLEPTAVRTPLLDRCVVAVAKP